ncbi:Poly(ADP-ribose) polymerase catalytic domain [Trinorchestia longiramus]|nr:Poly(ADP-ribose) polymerase catalytic domain [Trinorchestia longiramus]
MTRLASGCASGHWGVFSGEQNTRFMFLAEVALGKSKEIRQSDPSLTKAPPGFDSVVARGQKEPDSKQDVKLELDGRKVTVPVGKPVPQPKFKDSHFYQSEYLVYNEHQARLRFLLKNLPPFSLQVNKMIGRSNNNDVIGYAYALTVTVGGAIGYLKAGSLPSLGAGLLFGTALCYGAYQISENPRNYQFSLGTSILLGAFMGARFYNSGKFMPAGLIATLSVLNAGRLGARAMGWLPDSRY